MATSETVQEAIVRGNFPMEANILAALPKGCKVLDSSIWPSTWTQTARISVTLVDGTHVQYLLKCGNENGEVSLKGDRVPKLYYCERLQSRKTPETPVEDHSLQQSSTPYFILLDFINTSDNKPDPAQLCASLAELHLQSQSPEGKFGFHVQNCQGKVPQTVNWDSSWLSFFKRLITDLFDAELVLNGRWPPYEAAFEKLVQRVLPSLLNPLQANGRSIKPCLVHGNLNVGNAPTNLATGGPILFDAAALYAHHEYELGMWRRATVNFDDKYIWQYFKHYPPSEPIEKWEDRVCLYSLKFNLTYMVSCPGSQAVRKQIYDDMCYLGEKYS